MKYIFSCLLVILAYHGLISQKILVKEDGTILRITDHKQYDGYQSYKMKDGNNVLYIPDLEVDKLIDDPGYIPKSLLEEMLSVQKIRAIKMSLTGFIHQSAIFTYEQPLSSRWHVEVALRFHTGESNDFPFHQAEGWGVELGAKYLIADPYQLNKEGKVKHRMQHFYLKPSIGYSDRTERGFDDVDEYTLGYGGGSAGLQWVIADRMVLDFSAGLYYYSGSGTSTPQSGAFTIPILLNPGEGDFTGEDGIATSLSFKVGVLF